MLLYTPVPSPPLTSLLGVADPPVDVVKAVEGAVGGLLAFLVRSLDTCTCVFCVAARHEIVSVNRATLGLQSFLFTIVWVRVL